MEYFVTNESTTQSINELMVMMLVFRLFQLCRVHKTRKLVEVEHCVVLAVFAKEGHVLAEVHILEMVCDKTAIAALDALGELLQNVRLGH
jgi:hypothetical protein